MIAFALASAGSLTLAAAVVEAASRRWRPRDAVRWHRVWGALIVVAPAVVVVAALIVPPPGQASLVIVIAAGLRGAWVGAGWWRVRRIARMADPPPPMLNSRLRRIARDGIAEFRVHRRLQTAVTFGWRRPVVLLPAACVMWPDQRLEAIVRHEVAHVARGDYAVSIVSAVAQAGAWFVPGVWFAARRMRLLAEVAADARAADVIGRAEYAQHLFDTATALPRAGRVRLGGAHGIAVDLLWRIEALLNHRS